MRPHVFGRGGMVKTSRIFFTRTTGPIALKLGSLHLQSLYK